MNFWSLILVKQTNDNIIRSLFSLSDDYCKSISNQPMTLKCAILDDFLFYFKLLIKTNLKTEGNYYIYETTSN